MTFSIIIIALLGIVIYLQLKNQASHDAPVCLEATAQKDEKPLSDSQIEEGPNVKFIEIDSDQAAEKEVLNIDTVTTMCAYGKGEQETKVFLTSGKAIVVFEQIDSLVSRINAAR